MTRYGDETLLFGLIGCPVGHSLSPFIMNRAFAQRDMDAAYVAFGVRPEAFDESMDLIGIGNLSGLNVTFPFKQRVVEFVDEVSAEIEAIGAANTLVIEDDVIAAYNTDAVGTVTALETFARFTPGGRRVAIAGAGGSARAAAYGLLENNANEVSFLVRSPENARRDTEALRYAFSERRVRVVPLGGKGRVGGHRRLSDAARRTVEAAHLVINATPVGMIDERDEAIEAVARALGPRQCCFDFVYRSGETPFVHAARLRGARAIGGLALLVSQAAESFNLWTGENVDVSRMAEATERFYRGGSSAEEGVN